MLNYEAKINQIQYISPRKVVFLQHQIKIMGILAITLLLLLLAVAGIAIKIWGKKDGKFAGTCASQSPFLNKEGESCGFCGKTPDQFDSCTEKAHE